MKRRRTNGFTLIELLVVIAIIGILAAILFPVFARARENARASSCLSNMKQMGLAIEQYKQDYDGFYPYGGLVKGSTVVNWYDAFLDPYVKNRQVIFCPSQPDDWDIHYSYNEAFGYRMNDSRAGNPAVNFLPLCGKNIPIYDGVHEAGVTEPSTSIILTEASLYYYYLVKDVGRDPAIAKDQLTIFFPNNSAATMKARFTHEEAEVHNGGVNNTYADGHAKWQKLVNVAVPQNWCSLR